MPALVLQQGQRKNKTGRGTNHRRGERDWRTCWDLQDVVRDGGL